MKLPAALEQHVNSLYLTLSYDVLFGSLLFQIALWDVIGVAAGLTFAAFIQRYVNHSEAQQPRE
ncbi:hypothetical protein [Mycolicibacterium obuense]|uniref:Uncharacterized protein n=1 Tax=Mycolicibacterium obuense TaxID=1807 RepID=A0A0J6VWQ8_9MYCO|nr:hypothetical protein [Mycolicibacterium obuense]KMO75500.1 hypothetical protein MOBUDSM44075_03095 [Mycolicibacterium obuense]OKH71795.1 hypothetical protein EB72_22525 [Mycobacterium sp. SWH-M1]